VTAEDDDVRYERHLDKIQSKMPGRAATAFAWLRRPGLWPLRATAAVLLMVGGFAGFLPVLGFWMLPLGILLLAQDVPFLRSISVRMFSWSERFTRRVAVALKRSWINRRRRALFRQP
jgi:hypothetical protein